MTATLDRTKSAPTGPSPRNVVRVLAFREARWMLRHPLFLLGVVGTGVLVWKTTAWWHAPVLHRDDARLAGCMLPLAATTMIVCNLAAFRARRHGTEEIEDAAPTPQSRRTAAHLAAFTAPVLIACLIAVAYVAFLYAIGGVWRPSTQELATGPAIVALAAAVGVALARWIPSPIAGTLGLLALAAWQMLGSSLNGDLNGVWYAPFVDAGNENRIPELGFRPVGWHLVYLLGFAALFAGLASLRHGGRPRRFAVIGLALSLLVLGGVMQSRPIAPQRLALKIAMAKDPQASQHCETRGTITYCVLPAYRAWIDGWDDTVRRVLAPVPATARPKITIRQAFYPDELDALVALSMSEEERIKALNAEEQKAEGERPLSPLETTDDIILRPAWARGDDERAASLDLAWAVARRVIGVSGQAVTQERSYTPADIAEIRRGAEEDARMRDAGLLSPDAVPRPIPKLGDTYTAQGICWTAGQAREAIALWLAARAVPGAVSLLANPPRTEVVSREGNADSFDDLLISSFSPHGGNFLAGGLPASSPSGVRTAVELASRRTGAQVAAALTKDWSSWISAATSLDRLRSTLGLAGELPKPRRNLPAWLPPTCR